MTVWDEVLGHVRAAVDNEEDFRRWFAPTAYASDSGDRITVWVPTEAVRQHLTNQFLGQIGRALDTMGRTGTQVRFVVTGTDEEEETDAD
jgi:chromosomal replication initiation ATPase DnaA